jgi:hypothetical protein
MTLRSALALIAIASLVGCDGDALERMRHPLGVPAWQMGPAGVGPIMFGMTPDEVEVASGRSLIRVERFDDDCEVWTPKGRESLRMIFWDGRVAVFDVQGPGVRALAGIEIGMQAQVVAQRIASAHLVQSKPVRRHDFPMMAQVPAGAVEDRSLAIELAEGKVSSIVFGDPILVSNCTFNRRLRATGHADDAATAKEHGRPTGYDTKGTDLPDRFRETLTLRFKAWRFALPSQGDIERCFADKSGRHPAWFQGDFDGDGRPDVAAQVTSFGRGGVYLLLASGDVVEADAFVGSSGYVIESMRKGMTVSPIDEPAYVLKTDAVVLIRCESSAAVLALEHDRVRKVWISD